MKFFDDAVPYAGAQAWERLLAAPKPGQHIAQLFADQGFLTRSLVRFIGDGLRQGDGVMVIATPMHVRSVVQELARTGVPMGPAEGKGQLVLRDAEETLSTLMVDGRPNEARFRQMIDDAMARFRSVGYTRVRAFGEMVDLLRHRDLASTWALERLWHERIGARDFALLCGYSLDVFDPRNYGGVVQQLAAVHSDVVPVEDYARFERAVGRAYEEVFGGGTDAADLRRTFRENYAGPATMPDAAAAILALSEFVPGTVNAVLDSARRRYRIDA